MIGMCYFPRRRCFPVSLRHHLHHIVRFGFSILNAILRPASPSSTHKHPSHSIPRQASSLFNRPTMELPRRRKRDIPWLLAVAFFIPPLAVYLDGASRWTVRTILWVWLWGSFFLGIGLPIAMGWAIGYISRSNERRRMSVPMRRRLWVKNPEGKKPFQEVSLHVEPGAVSQPEGNSINPLTKQPRSIRFSGSTAGGLGF